MSKDPAAEKFEEVVDGITAKFFSWSRNMPNNEQLDAIKARAAIRQAADVYAAERVRETLEQLKSDLPEKKHYRGPDVLQQGQSYGRNEAIEIMRHRIIDALEQAGKEKRDERS